MRLSRPPLPTANAVRIGLCAAACAGAICLLAATFATVIQIRVGAATRVAGHDTQLSGWDRHGAALAVIAAFAAAMAVGSWRGLRAAMVALAALGVAAVLIAVIGDAPHLHETGFIGEVYEDARAGAGAGFYLETLGGALLVAAGGLLLALAGATDRAPART
jgi:hypothetical protein